MIKDSFFNSGALKSFCKSLSILKDYKYCDFSEAVYLFGSENGNNGLRSAALRPDTDNLKSIEGCESCQRSFVLRRPSRRSENDYEIENFSKGERLIKKFFNDHWKKLQQINSKKLTIYESLFFPLPSETLQFDAIMDTHTISWYPENFKFFQFQDLLHEVIFSNKMSSGYCLRLKIPQSSNDEYFSHKIKTRNLIIKTVAHYLYIAESKNKWNLQSIANHFVLKKILANTYIPDSSYYKLIKQEIRKVIPSELVRSGPPHLSKWNKKELAQSPLLFSDGLESDSNGQNKINYQAIRIILRTLIITKKIHQISSKPSLLAEDIMKHPLLLNYASILTPRSFEFIRIEAERYIDFIKNIDTNR